MTAVATPRSQDALPVRRALLSVSDKSGLVEAARALSDLGVELISTGGTRAALRDAGLHAREVAELTGFPEMMDGRVKTLHPAVHGGLLARRDDPAHATAMVEHGISGIDLLYVTLYPFEATVGGGAAFDDCVEQIDIGGPAMIRSAAKNHAHVSVCVTFEDLQTVIAALRESGGVPVRLRRELAARAFARTAAYDAAIADWFARQITPDRAIAAQTKTIAGALRQRLRYGENPHQVAALYASGPAVPSVIHARQAQGKPLGYNNIADADAALELAAEFDAAESAAAVIVKHANPCGVALDPDLAEAFRLALEADPVSAYGGIVAVNRPLDAAAAARIVTLFAEVVIAPDADEAALALFAKRKSLRLLLTGGLPDPSAPGETFRSVTGGFLVQSRDSHRLTAADLRIVTRRAPTEAELRDMLLAFTIAKHVKSNAVVFAKDGRTAGIGAGQMNRRDSARIAALRALESAHLAGRSASFAEGSACASDAFFPFPDGLLQAVEAGATAVIQPGGSIRDDEVIAAADAAGVAMAFTGVRAFRH